MVLLSYYEVAALEDIKYLEDTKRIHPDEVVSFSHV